jgi:hypothetical protein
MADEKNDDQREKFKAALEAKQNKGQQGGQGGGAAGNSGKDTSKGAPGNREQRRKNH